MPSIAITRAYEAIYILDPNSGEDQIAAVTTRYRSLVEAQGGQVQKVDVWERRKLAYEVKGRTEGIYVIMQFTGTASAEAELRLVFQISEDQIRSMIVKIEEPKDEPAAAEAPARAPRAEVTESAPAQDTEAPAQAEDQTESPEAEPEEALAA